MSGWSASIHRGWVGLSIQFSYILIFEALCHGCVLLALMLQQFQPIDARKRRCGVVISFPFYLSFMTEQARGRAIIKLLTSEKINGSSTITTLMKESSSLLFEVHYGWILCENDALRSHFLIHSLIRMHR